MEFIQGKDGQMSGRTTCTMLEAKCQHEPKSTNPSQEVHTPTLAPDKGNPKEQIVRGGNPKGQLCKMPVPDMPNCRLVLLLCQPPLFVGGHTP